LSTIFGLAFSVILSISLLGVFDSFDAVMVEIEEDIGDWELNARSSSFESASVWQSSLSSHPLGFEYWEFSLELIAKLSYNSRSKDVYLQSYLPDSAIRPIKLAKSLPNDNGIIISRRVASDLDLSVGSTLDVEHLAFGGPFGYYLKTSKVNVVGIHESVISLVSYMKLQYLRALIDATTDIVNTIYLTRGDITETLAQQLLYQLPGITIIEFMEPVLRDRKADIEEMRQILWPALFLSAVFAFAMVMNTVSINVSERTRETGTMLALGTQKWVIARLLLIENLILGMIGLTLGMILGQISLDYIFINGTFKESLPQLIMPVVIIPFSWILVIGLFILSISLAQILGIQKATTLDLAVATKVLE
jgi:ABC-type antimicrobial peptide transport system permease subunit